MSHGVLTIVDGPQSVKDASDAARLNRLLRSEITNVRCMMIAMILTWAMHPAPLPKAEGARGAAKPVASPPCIRCPKRLVRAYADSTRALRALLRTSFRHDAIARKELRSLSRANAYGLSAAEIAALSKAGVRRYAPRIPRSRMHPSAATEWVQFEQSRCDDRCTRKASALVAGIASIVPIAKGCTDPARACAIENAEGIAGVCAEVAALEAEQLYVGHLRTVLRCK